MKLKKRVDDVINRIVKQSRVTKNLFWVEWLWVESLWVSPRNNLLTMLFLYQALGKARISLRRRMSYLN